MNPRTLDQWRDYFHVHFDADRVLADIRTLHAEARWSSTARLGQLTESLAQELTRRGFADARVLSVPADGRTRYGGWVMPLSWSPRHATLERLAAHGDVELLADYDRCPHHLMMYSGSTGGQPVTAALLAVRLPLTPDQLDRARGAIVLLDKPPTLACVERLTAAGVLGVLSDDVRILPGIRDQADVDDAVSYYNYSLPPWDTGAARPFGFAISPRAGRALRGHLAGEAPVMLRAAVDIDFTERPLPILTASVPGRTRQQIIVTGHIDEPGANDNASGPAMALEIARVLLTLNEQAGRPVLERGLRFVFSMEVRGMQAALATQPQLFRGGVLGLNLDMVGTDPQAAHAVLSVIANTPALPDPGLPLMLECLGPLAQHGERYVPRLAPFDTNDNAMGEPAVGVPTTIVMQCPDKVYHTSLDTPDVCSRDAIARLGQALGTYTGFMAAAREPQLDHLLDATYAYAADTLTKAAPPRAAESADDTSGRCGYLLERERQRLRHILRLVTDHGPSPFAAGADAEAGALRPEDRLADAAALHVKADRLCDKLADHARRCFAHHPSRSGQATGEADPWLAEARRRIPLKTFKGHFTYAGLPDDQQQALRQAVGSEPGWAAPGWLQLALALATGKRSLADIHRILRHEGERGGSLEQLVRTFDALAAAGHVRMRPCLTGAEVTDALRRAGARPNMLLVAHCSLSQFGYLAGGAQTLIAALTDAIGAGGTLAMPTHTLSWIGRPIYDPRDTPSRVGIVSETFRRQPGVLRSEHPTHAVAARGPLARTLIEKHDVGCAPLGEQGFWGRFLERDGWVAMLCPLSSNTLLHAAELRQGLALPDLLVPRLEDGRRRLVRCPGAPWHTDWFQRVHDHLEQAGQLHRAPLGEGAVSLMRGREAIHAAEQILREDPLAPAPAGCECAWCRHVRQGAGSRV